MANKFLFAWADANTPFDPLIHNREDAEVVSLDCTHEEGNFAALTITVRNPRIGLLAPGRQQWAWLSWLHTVGGVDQLDPLFYGRLVAVPDNMIAEAVTLSFTARPSNYNDRKAAVANSLRVLPYYDPVWIDERERENPDVVLEGYARMWHVNRVTHDVSASDIINGEDGNEDFGGGLGVPNEVPYDSVSIRLEQAPLRRILVDGAVGWPQAGSGGLTLFDGTIESFTGDALISDWPKTDSGIGGGWKVSYGAVTDLEGIAALDDNTWVQGQQSTKPQVGEDGKPAVPNPFARSDIPPGWLFKKAQEWSFLLSFSLEGVLVPRWKLGGTIRVNYEASRQRTEHARFILTSQVQAIVSDPGDDEVMELNLSSADLSLPIDGEIPIGDVGRRQYFNTDRGQQSIAYLINRARAALLHRARAVRVEFNCRFERAINLSCRKTARLYDHRLPGGEAIGKVASYKFSANVTAGLLIGTVTIACAVGYGGAYTEQPGEPVWVEEGYVERGWQAYESSTIVLPAGDVFFEPPTATPNDDGWDFTQPVSKADAVVYFDPGYSVDEQMNLLRNAIQAPAWDPVTAPDARNILVENAKAALKKYPTVISFKLKPVTGGPFNTDYDLIVSELIIPAQVDLEAPSSP